MKIIDLHTDTLTRLPADEIDYFNNNEFMVNYDQMRRGDYLAVAAAVFLNMENQKDLFKTTLGYFDALDRIVKNHPTEVKYYDGKDDGRIQFIRTIEEGEIIENSLENLECLASRGLKMMTLTWNHRNSLAYPNRNKGGKNIVESEYGLTASGLKVLEYLEDHHILFDVSHLGDKAFYESLEVYHGPIVASHSNARAITPVVRNLKDDMIKIIADSGGVIGLNLCEYFVMSSELDYLPSLVAHLEHIREIGGDDVLALGSDYDGIGLPPALQTCDQWNSLFSILRDRGWQEDLIEKLAYRNAARVLSWTL